MHIGFVVYDSLDRTSGGYRYDRELVSRLERRGDDVEVISVSREFYADALEDSFSSSLRARLDRPFDILLQDELCHPTLWRVNDRLERPGAIVSLVHLLRSGGIEGENGDTGDDGTYTLGQRAIERRYLSSVDAAICTSSDTRERTLELASIPTLVAHPAGRHEGAAVAPDAVRSRARATASADALRIGFVGNLVERKNLETVLRACARLEDESVLEGEAVLEGAAVADGKSASDRGREREWELTVVGSHEADPEYARKMVELASHLDIDDRVTFVGEVDDGTLASIYERSHVLAVPARYEGFGMVYLESMEYGVVPIASAVGGARDIVVDGENGFIVDPDSTAHLARLLARLARDRDRLADLGARALEAAATHPTWDDAADDIRSFLLERVPEVDEYGGRG